MGCKINGTVRAQRLLVCRGDSGVTFLPAADKRIALSWLRLCDRDVTQIHRRQEHDHYARHCPAHQNAQCSWSH